VMVAGWRVPRAAMPCLGRTAGVAVMLDRLLIVR
jgi:hypothetical protein